MRAACCLFTLVCVLNPGVLRAEERADEIEKKLNSLLKTVETLQKTVAEQQKVINELRRNQIATSNQSVAPSGTASIDPDPLTAGSKIPTAIAKGVRVGTPYLPDIGAIADIVGTLSDIPGDDEGNDRISAREFEVVFSHDVDPFTKLGATVTFSDFEEAALEEAYATLYDLPADLGARIGKYKPLVGKAVALHRDSLDTVDEPLVVQRYFGAEGFSKAGAELSLFTPLSSDAFTQHLTTGLLEGGNGHEGALFGESRDRPTFYAHLKNFFELSAESNLELGGSYLLGSADEDSAYEVNVFGIDLTAIHHIDAVQRLKFQTEAYFQDRDETFSLGEEPEHSEEEHSHRVDTALEIDSADGIDSQPFGFYSLIDYRLAERWALGARYDYVEPIGVEQSSGDDDDEAYSLYLTFLQSEFARWRLQYQHQKLFDGAENDLLFLQGVFAIGTHKHKLQ
jgi:hypothetical protein